MHNIHIHTYIHTYIHTRMNKSHTGVVSARRQNIDELRENLGRGKQNAVDSWHEMEHSAL
jgi:hypothetical protein